MADLNNLNIIGRLTRDAELKYTANGTAVSKFSIAVNRRRKNGDQWEDEANFFDVTLWGKIGRNAWPIPYKRKTGMRHRGIKARSMAARWAKSFKGGNYR
jgi:single-strand DNA-binding protein